MAVETQAPRDAERVAVSRKASKSVYYTPCASPVVTCLGSGTRMALKRVPSLLKTPSCFGGGAGAKGGRSSGRVKDSEWQEMAMKSHRLLQVRFSHFAFPTSLLRRRKHKNKRATE